MDTLSIIRRFTLAMMILATLQIMGCSQPSSETQTADSQENAQADSNVIKPVIEKADPNTKKTAAAMPGMGKMNFPASKDIRFKDKVESNAELPKRVSELEFTNTDGSQIKIADYVGKKNLILVFTEGFNGMLCPFCKTQTSRLVANYEQFKERDCEIIVVYPGPADHLDEFVEAAMNTEKDQIDKVPFPIVLDKNFTATDYFDIHSMHAHPSTYLIDKQGSVQFAYVGTDMTADRPSIKAMLERLDQLKN